jgi:hypothetical protein
MLKADLKVDQGGADIRAALPDHVHIKRPTRTFSSHFYYALLDGQIWMRANEEVTGIQEPWRKVGLHGVPTNDAGDSRFEIPVRIEEIVADADELIALSDAKHFYLIRFDNLSPIGTDLWRDGDGAPGGALLLDARHRHNRGFSLGRRNQDVEYWDDPAGNPHSWGTEGITTLYLLCENGREITIFDTGLQPNFGRHVPTPERGDFVAESISASASTVFLIDRRGRMYTRLCDFDTLGANPMFFKYSYTDEKRKGDRTDDPQTMYRTIKLPPEPWKRQPRIELTGAARISRDITILQNGKGNHARELRVAGINAGGELGYHWKSITATRWAFRVTGEAIDADRMLDPAEAGAASAPRPSYDNRYRGKIVAGPYKLEAELLDFNLFASPATLLVRDGGCRLRLALYTIDAWTYATRDDPGRDGTPLVFLAAIGQPPGQEDELRTDGLRELARRLEPRNLKPFAFLVRASLDYVELTPNFLFGSIRAELTRTGSGFDLPATARAQAAVLRSGYLSQASLDYLSLDGLREVRDSRSAADVRWQKLRLNRYALEQLNAQRRAVVTSAIGQTALGWALAWVWQNIGRLLRAQALTNRNLARDTQADYEAARVLLQNRLAELEKELGHHTRRRLRRPFRRWRRLGR